MTCLSVPDDIESFQISQEQLILSYILKIQSLLSLREVKIDDANVGAWNSVFLASKASVLPLDSAYETPHFF